MNLLQEKKLGSLKHRTSQGLLHFFPHWVSRKQLPATSVGGCPLLCAGGQEMGGPFARNSRHSIGCEP